MLYNLQFLGGRGGSSGKSQKKKHTQVNIKEQLVA